VNFISGFADISLAQLMLVACVALFASVIGGLAGYGTGALMPLVLVPLIGAEPVVPIIAISAIFTNLSRVAAYRRHADARRAAIVILASALTTALGAYGYTRLTSAGAAVVIGTMLILSVPLRRLARRRDIRIGDAGLGRYQPDQDLGVRPRRRRLCTGIRIRAADRRDRAARGIFRQGLCRAHAGASSHRHSRRCRDCRRPGHDLGGGAAFGVIIARSVSCEAIQGLPGRRWIASLRSRLCMFSNDGITMTASKTKIASLAKENAGFAVKLPAPAYKTRPEIEQDLDALGPE
jgi:sulfite exporter TauE/SafE